MFTRPQCDVEGLAALIMKFILFCEEESIIKSITKSITFDQFSKVKFNGHDIIGKRPDEFYYIANALEEMQEWCRSDG